MIESINMYTEPDDQTPDIPEPDSLSDALNDVIYSDPWDDVDYSNTNKE